MKNFPNSCKWKEVGEGHDHRRFEGIWHWEEDELTKYIHCYFFLIICKWRKLGTLLMNLGVFLHGKLFGSKLWGQIQSRRPKDNPMLSFVLVTPAMSTMTSNISLYLSLGRYLRRRVEKCCMGNRRSLFKPCWGLRPGEDTTALPHMWYQMLYRHQLFGHRSNVFRNRGMWNTWSITKETICGVN